MARQDSSGAKGKGSVQEASGQQPAAKSRKPITIACVGCAAIAVIAIVVAIISVTAWDSRDSRLHEGSPLPENIAYIGRWISDGVVSARVDTFAIAGDKIACDFAIRNDSDRDITVNAIGRTIIAHPLDARLSEASIPLNLLEGDTPMEVTDDENVLGLQFTMGVWMMIAPGDPESAPPPESFTLSAGEIKRARYRPPANQMIMPASALRIAVLLEGEDTPRPFYFMRRSAGIGGWFEKGVETAVQGPR